MNDNKQLILYKLLLILNSSEAETNETIIARAMIENREHLDEISLDHLAEKYYVSQASISRFIKQQGFANYNEFRSNMKLSEFIMKNNNTRKSTQIEDARRQMVSSIQKALDDHVSIDDETILHIKDVLLSHRRIVFIGSELSMTILRLLQNILVSRGYDVYTLMNTQYQKEVIAGLHEEDLVVGVSIANRWYKRCPLDEIRKTKADTLLLTIEDQNHPDDVFDETIIFGKWIDNNTGYHQLMQLETILYQII